MIDALTRIHTQVLNTIPKEYSRYLYNQINWDARGICVAGDRGVGKTTLLCQYLLEKYKTAENALYISADNINVLSFGLFHIAQEYFSHGGQALFIDEVHKYPNWSIELKNILDTYRKKQIVFSASSSLELKKSKGDLSRRTLYYELAGLSFREFLKFNKIVDIPTITLDLLIKKHVVFAEQLTPFTILKHFKEYLLHGYYPFYLEGVEDYYNKIDSMIEKVIYEDIVACYNLKQATLFALKKLLWLIASSNGLVPNVDKISKNLAVSREVIYNGLEYLNRAGLINALCHNATGMKLVRKPEKVFLNNTSLHYAINRTLTLHDMVGNVREIFFVNQMQKNCLLQLHDKGDFILNEKEIIEVGGPGKNTKQIKGEKNGYLALDGIEIGFGKKIPLYLFGFLY